MKVFHLSPPWSPTTPSPPHYPTPISIPHPSPTHRLPWRREEAIFVSGGLATVRKAEDDGSEGGGGRRRAWSLWMWRRCWSSRPTTYSHLPLATFVEPTRSTALMASICGGHFGSRQGSAGVSTEAFELSPPPLGFNFRHKNHQGLVNGIATEQR